MFLYFVPTRSTPRECGLQYALDLEPSGSAVIPHVRKVLQNGPDGGSGDVYTYAETGVGYYRDQQTWQKLPDSPAWVGWPKAARITPDSITRPKQVSGKQVVLADEQTWLVPVARRPVIEDAELRWMHSLPQKIELIDGVWQYGSTEEKFLNLFDICTRWSAYRFSGGKDEDGHDLVELDLATIMQWSVETMAYNYRLGPIEFSRLGLLNNYNSTAILDALFDLDGLLELLSVLNEKKTVQRVNDSELIAVG